MKMIRTTCLALTVALWLPCAVAAQSTPTSPERRLADAWVLLASGQADEALAVADAMMRDNVLTHRALQLAVACDLKLGQSNRALDRYEAWLTPSRPEDVYLLAQVALERLRALAVVPDPMVQADAQALLQQEGLTPAGGLPPATPEGPALDAALARVGDQQAAARLTERLSGSMGPEAAFVLQAVADARITAAAPRVRALLDSPDPAVRSAAAQALGRIGSSADFEKLRTLATERVAFVRASAQVALSTLGDPEAVKDIDALLRSDAGELRLMAAEALGLSEAPRWSPFISELLTNESLLVRVQAALLLSRAGIDVAVAQNTLAQAIAGDNPILRAQAAAAFAEAPKPDPALLRRFLRDPDPRVQIRGIRGLLTMVR